MPQVVITAVGPDRPGLVDELTAFLLEVGANVADSSMVNLGGQFALLMLVQISKDRIATVQADAPDVGRRIGADGDRQRRYPPSGRPHHDQRDDLLAEGSCNGPTGHCPPYYTPAT